MKLREDISRIESIGKFVIGLLLIVSTVGWIVPVLNQKRPIELIEFAAEHEIDSGSLFYTESPEAMDAIYRLSKR